MITRYAELNFLIPRVHLHSRGRRPEAFGRAALRAGDPKRSAELPSRPETRSVWQSCPEGRRPEAFGRAALAAGDPKRLAELPSRPETQSVWQSCLC